MSTPPSVGNNHAGPSNSGITKYRVETTDVIQDMRVNVSEEGSNTIIWYKERFLNDEEIVENLVHNSTNTILWTIHRPLRGWYIRLRSPGFPPGIFIPLTPVPSTSPLHVDAALSFTTRTNMAAANPPPLPTSESQFTLQDEDIASSSTSSLHSYPPTPTAVINVHPPSPSRASTSSDKAPVPKKMLRRPPKRSSQITQFLLSPSSIQPLQQPDPGSSSFFYRALSVLKNHRPSHSNSFTLSRVLDFNANANANASGSGSPPPPYVSNVSIAQATGASQSSAAILPHHQQQQQQPHLQPPLLVFHDHTPVLTVRSLTGLLEIDKNEEIYLGVDTSFWIAVALTYLEFLEERESYLAALND